MVIWAVDQIDAKNVERKQASESSLNKIDILNQFDSIFDVHIDSKQL